MQNHQQNLVGKINDTLQPLGGASVTVTDQATGLPASLYSDNGVTSLAQPITTDENGLYSFYAADGKYLLEFSGARFDTFTREIILEDPSDDPYAKRSELAVASGAELIGYTTSGGVVTTVKQALDAVGGTYAATKDTSGGHVGLTGYSINTKNAAGTVASAITNVATASRVYTLPDKDITVAGLSDIPSLSVLPLGSATVSTPVAAIDFLTTFTASYNKYLVELEGLLPSASAALQMALANAGVLDGALNYRGLSASTLPTAATVFTIGVSNTGYTTGTLEVRNVNDTVASSKTVGFRGITGVSNALGEGLYLGAAAVSGFRLFLSGGANFTRGTVRVYGIKNS